MDIHVEFLRKGNKAFSCASDTYADYFRAYLLEGLHSGSIDLLGKSDGFDFSNEVRTIFPKYTFSNYANTVKAVATMLDSEESLEQAVNKTAQKLVRSATWQADHKATDKELVTMWNNVYDELALKDRTEIIPKLAEAEMLEFGSGRSGLHHKKTLVQGLSNLKNSNVTDFHQLAINLFVNESKTEVVSVMHNFLKDSANLENPNTLSQLAKELTRTIFSTPYEEQMGSWNQVRLELQKHLIEDPSDFSKKLAASVMDSFENVYQKEAFIQGISGMSVLLDKEENLPSVKRPSLK